MKPFQISAGMVQRRSESSLDSGLINPFESELPSKDISANKDPVKEADYVDALSSHSAVAMRVGSRVRPKLGEKNEDIGYSVERQDVTESEWLGMFPLCIESDINVAAELVSEPNCCLSYDNDPPRPAKKQCRGRDLIR